MGFRATLHFRKFKVALNPMYRIFLNFAKSCILFCLSKVDIKKTFVSRKWYQRVHRWLGSFLIPWLQHQVITSGNNDTSKSTSWKRLETALSHLNLLWATLNASDDRDSNVWRCCKQMHPRKKFIMDAGSKRFHHQWNVVKVVMLCLVSLGLQTTWCNYIFQCCTKFIGQKLSSATHPVCSTLCNIKAATLWQLHCITFLRNTYAIVLTNYLSVSPFVLIVAFFKSILR